MHIAAALSLINIGIAVTKKDISLISLPKNTKIFIGLLTLSAVIVGIYSTLDSGRVADRFFKDFSYTAIFIAITAPSIKLNKKDIKIVELSILLSCSLMALVGIYDHFINNVGRTSGNINLSIIYATNLAILTTLNLMLFVKAIVDRKYILSGLYIIAFIIGSMGVAFSGSRGPMIAIFIIMACVLLVAGFRLLGKTKTSIITIFLLAILAYGVNESPIGSRIQAGFTNATSETNQRTSTGVRFELWQAGLKCILENPLFGTGIARHDECFKSKLIEDPAFIKPFALNWMHLHNDILNILVWIGMIGGGLFFSYLIYSTYLFLISVNSSYSASLGLIACSTFLICGLTNTPSMRAASITLLFFILLLCHQMLGLRETKLKRD